MSDKTFLSALMLKPLGDLWPKTSKTEGKGARLARERAKAKRVVNQKTYKGLPERTPSRQVIRAETRRIEKMGRSVAKEKAMQERRMGGAAAVR